MSNLRLALVLGAIFVAILPDKSAAEALVVSTYKIVPRHGAHDQSWRQSLRALQYQFNYLVRLGMHKKKSFGSSSLIALQRTSRTRPKDQRKIYKRRLDKIEKILNNMRRPERAKAIKNLQTRISHLKTRLGRVS